MSLRSGAAVVAPNGASGASSWAALALAAGILLGGAAAVNTTMGALLTVLGAAAIVIGLRPQAVLVPLGGAAFVENIEIGGATISRFVAAAALFVVLAEMARHRLAIVRLPPLTWATLYGVWALASALWTVSGHRTYIGLSSLLVSATFMIALAALIRTRHDLDLALYGIAFSAFAVGLVSVLLFVGGSGDRESGFAGDPNFFAAYQVYAFPVLLALSAEARQGWLRWTLFAGVVTSIGATFTTLSRGGILALVLIGALLLVLPARSFFRSLGQKTLATTVIAIGVGLALMVSYTELSHRINSLVTGQEAAGSGRVNEWKGAWRSVHERPLLGLGFGSFPAVSNQLVRETPGTDLYHFDERPTGVFVHNAYLGSLAELGIPGLVLFVGLLGSTIAALKRTAAKAKRVGDLSLARIANALALSMVGWSLTSFFLSSETARPFWITIGIALALPKLLSPPPLPERWRDERA